MASNRAILRAGMSVDDDIDTCQESEFTHAQFLFRAYLFPFVYIFGIFSNTINIFVFSQKSMRNQPVNWFFLALSCSDLMTLVASIFVFSIPVYAEITRDPQYIDWSVQLIVWFYPLAQTGLTMSVYVTILVSVHRYLGVCHPFLIRRISNSSAVKAVIGAAVVFAFVFNTSRWFELHAQPCFYGDSVLQRNSSVVYPTNLMMNSLYTLIFRNAAYTIVMFFLPFAVLTYVNLRIIATLQQSYRLRKEMTTSRTKRCNSTIPTDTIVTKLDGYSAVVPVENSGRSDGGSGIFMGTASGTSTKNEKKENGVTIMLVAITTEFLLFNLIAFANNIIELSSIRFFQDIETLLVELSTFLVNVNGASTIVIYLIFGSKYRNVFVKLLRRVKCCDKPKQPVYSQAHFETTQLLDNSKLDMAKNKQSSVIRRTDTSSTRYSSVRKPINNNTP